MAGNLLGWDGTGPGGQAVLAALEDVVAQGGAIIFTGNDGTIEIGIGTTHVVVPTDWGFMGAYRILKAEQSGKLGSQQVPEAPQGTGSTGLGSDYGILGPDASEAFQGRLVHQRDDLGDADGFAVRDWGG